jgi:outer membrane protein TolC
MKFARHHLSPVGASLTALFLACAVARAQPPAPVDVPDSIDLKTAIGFALKNNFAIRQAQERIRQQEGVVVEVASREIPNVGASAAYQRNDKDISSGFPASDRTWQISVTASQVIFNGNVRSSVKAAKLARDAAVLELQAVINEALLQVRTAFYAVLLAREQIKVQESNLELLQQQLKTATDRYQAGTVSSFERLRAEVAVANAKVPLITARNNHRLAIEAMRQALGFVGTNKPESLRKVPDFVGTLDFTPVQFDLQQSFEAARAHRPDLDRLAKLTEAREEGVRTARSGYYPSVSAFGGWQLRKGATDSFGDSDNGWLVGLQSQWNIFDGRATAGRLTQARSLLEQTKLSFNEAQLAVEVEVRRAYSQWQQAVELAEASQRVVEQATEAVRLANARYNAGTGTQLDVLAAQVDLTTARTNQIQAFYAYNVAVAALRKAMGQSDEFVGK